MIKKLLLFSLIIAFVIAGTAPKNLQVLKYEDVEQTKSYMKKMSKDLGVKCKFCHDLDDFASDENKHKTLARDMMKMVHTINGDFINWKDANPVTCWTCHQGKKEPPKK